MKQIPKEQLERGMRVIRKAELKVVLAIPTPRTLEEIRKDMDTGLHSSQSMNQLMDEYMEQEGK